MKYRLILLNVMLVSLLTISGLNVRNLARAYDVTHQPRLVIAMPEPAPKLTASTAQLQPAPEDWTDIPAKNLFSFDRSDVTLVAPPPPPPPPNNGPKPVLFGTLSLGSERVAMVAPGQGNSRAFRPMHLGESIDGWTLVEIQEKAIVVTANSTRATIILNDPTAQLPRDYTRTAPAATAPPAMVPAPVPTAAAPGTTKPKTKIIQTPFGPKEVPIDPPPND